MSTYNKTDVRELMAILISGYRDFTKMIYDHEHGFRTLDKDKLENLRRMVKHIENTIRFLDECDRFIIYNEVMLYKSGKWYLEYYSESSYRRRSKIAYENYLRLLEL